MEFGMMYLGVPVEHDTIACKAWQEFYSLPYRPRYYDMMRIANKYNTTPEEMRKHKDCTKHIKEWGE